MTDAKNKSYTFFPIFAYFATREKKIPKRLYGKLSCSSILVLHV